MKNDFPSQISKGNQNLRFFLFVLKICESGQFLCLYIEHNKRITKYIFKEFRQPYTFWFAVKFEFDFPAKLYEITFDENREKNN